MAADIARRLAAGERRPGEIAVLCRSVRHSAGDPLQALARRGIPHRVAGDEREHPVAAQTLALLRLTRALTSADLLAVLAGRLAPADLHAALTAAAGRRERRPGRPPAPGPRLPAAGGDGGDQAGDVPQLPAPVLLRGGAGAARRGQRPLAFGEAVHAALEQFNLARRAGAVPAAAELPAWFAAAFDRTRCETEGQYRQLLARGRVLLGRYHGWAAARAEQVLAAETPFEAPYVDGQGRTHTVRGRYDLIVRGPQGVEIVDDKTGKRDGSTLRVNKRRSNSDNDPELANRFERDPEEYKCQWCPFRQPCAASPVHWY